METNGKLATTPLFKEKIINLAKSSSVCNILLAHLLSSIPLKKHQPSWPGSSVGRALPQYAKFAGLIPSQSIHKDQPLNAQVGGQQIDVSLSRAHVLALTLALSLSPSLPLPLSLINK